MVDGQLQGNWIISRYVCYTKHIFFTENSSHRRLLKWDRYNWTTFGQGHGKGHHCDHRKFSDLIFIQIPLDTSFIIQKQLCKAKDLSLFFYLFVSTYCSSLYVGTYVVLVVNVFLLNMGAYIGRIYFLGAYQLTDIQLQTNSLHSIHSRSILNKTLLQ